MIDKDVNDPNPKIDPAPNSNTEKEADDWVSGADPMTGAVTLRREDGREQTFRIVVEDEADPSHGTVSYVSPLARAVLTYGPGDTVEIAGGKAVILDFR
jgi:transcription elongation GreA/GreB family factor